LQYSLFSCKFFLKQHLYLEILLVLNLSYKESIFHFENSLLRIQKMTNAKQLFKLTSLVTKGIICFWKTTISLLKNSNEVLIVHLFKSCFMDDFFKTISNFTYQSWLVYDGWINYESMIHYAY